MKVLGTSLRPRVYQGRVGVIQALREWVEPFSEYCIEPLDFIEQEDRVVIPQRQWGVGSLSGAPVEIEVTHVYEVRDSQILGSMSTTLSKRPSKPWGLSE